ncbi:AEC family transporter [Roseibium sp. RKSG952]|uniref:AEC family transporter n=1 Tax=Roseibium sp. RKSG952 TaxID=2529384 RepID=UPI0012BC8D2F|nr:AEC family transporter [Roseibium sp. RKSG952]MTH97696.1 AEC family transporter [Roseibium sp. RKSG952]
MLTTLNAILPVILVIAAGHVVARSGLISGDQWRGIERLAYYLLFPAVLFEKIAYIDFSALPALPIGATLLASIVTLSALVLGLRPIFERVWSINGPRFTSIFQGSLRWNAFVALAIADSLIGDEGVALIALAMVVMIPVLNILSVLVLSRYANAEPPTLQRILKDLATNPFILSILAGLFANMLGIEFPGFVDDALFILASAALPVGILCVGAGLDLAALRRPGPALTSGTFIRLTLMPVIGAGFALLFGVTGAALTAIIIALSVPSASNSYLMAKLMGGDAKLMAEILTLQTLAATVTIPLAIYLFAAV